MIVNDALSTHFIGCIDAKNGSYGNVCCTTSKTIQLNDGRMASIILYAGHAGHLALFSPLGCQNILINGH